MEFLIQFFARLFATFKLKNPAVAAAVLFALSVGITSVQSGTFYGLFQTPVWLSEVVKYVNLFLLAVTGSQTFQYTKGTPASTSAK